MKSRIVLTQKEFFDVSLGDGTKLGTIHRYSGNGEWSVLAQDKIGNIYLLENQSTLELAVAELIRWHGIEC